ncbi:isochorismatase family protein [Phenylobacterium aquaticum]|uniref:isochorismatase family protein n=1 Tax=Phenylobacterium aquaticum TaxID=1763816 RepID=UPI001F5D8EB5|nr:cysteine hydrolase [Phenylobacterium aquaticum]
MTYDPRAALVCLDLQRYRHGGPSADPVLAACRRALDDARRRGWPVLHVHARPPGADLRPLPGLEPRPSEPVFLRRGPSAFSNSAFAQAAHASGGPLALIGFAMLDTVLATAFAAADRDLETQVILDAVGVGTGVDPHALSATFLALAPHGRAVTLKDLFQEEAERFAAANLP